MFVTHLRTVTMRAVLASSLFLALLALHASRVDAFECPTIDEETMVEVAKACIADEEGLCGETCFGSVRDAALASASTPTRSSARAAGPSRISCEGFFRVFRVFREASEETIWRVSPRTRCASVERLGRTRSSRPFSTKTPAR